MCNFMLNNFCHFKIKSFSYLLFYTNDQTTPRCKFFINIIMSQNNITTESHLTAKMNTLRKHCIEQSNI